MRIAWKIALGMTCMALAGCGANRSEEPSATIVHATTAETIEYEEGLEYLGVVKAKETKNYAFLAGGKLETMFVKEGDQVKAGDPLAKLDTSYVEININTAKTSVASLKTALETAQFAKNASDVLYASGDISEMEWKSQNTEYESLAGNYRNALDSLSQLEKTLEDSTLYADADGYVMEVPFKEGEIVGAGYPAAILKSSQKVVTVGVSTDDIMKVSHGSKVLINDTLNATVDTIGQYPDESTRAYPVDLVFSSDEYVIGDMVMVKIITGKTEGCFVPMQSLINMDGLDYVYVIGEDGLVTRKEVTCGQFIDDMVCVEGIEDGMQIVSSGVKNIKENDLVAVAETEQEPATENDNEVVQNEGGL